MTDINQVSDDLKFVREAVDRKDRPPSSPAAILWLWAIYVLVGYVLLDFAPRYAGWFFMIGGFGGGLISWRIGRREALRQGQVDAPKARREWWHWAGGMIVAFLSAFALACVIPALRGQAGSQVFVVLIGMVYFLWGVQREQHFIWLGLLLIAGGICIGFIPKYPWTSLGAVIALGLIVPTFFRKKQA